MNAMLVVLPIIFPILAGCGLLLVKFNEDKKRHIVVSVLIILTSIFAFAAMLSVPNSVVDLIRFNDTLTLSFKIDGCSQLFGGMVSILWIVTMFYAFEYMKHEGMEDRFFAFFTMTFGVVLGIAFAANMLTLYIFYEFLTLVTLPLVMHAWDSKARYAGKKYIIYMMFGATLAFIGLMFIIKYGGNDFIYGGSMNLEMVKGHEDLLRLVFILAFIGFGVKAAIFPFHNWLPTASVAPTPVTALLHAVAVVKSGVFAILRLTYFSYGVSFLSGSWAQMVMMGMAIVTILFGSIMALRTPHIKRRFAYSTISNLSYIIFGLSLMTPLGLSAGLLHMIVHAFVKITLFFVAGAILYKTHREYVYEIEGFARLMPVTFASLTIASLALMGVPLFAGFISKWSLASAAVANVQSLAYAGILALMVSAFLTALYCFSIILRAYCKTKREYPKGYEDHVEDPNYLMCGPLILLCVVVLVIGAFPQPLVQFIGSFVGAL